MSEYILILVIQSTTATSILFPSKQACETAKVLALEEFAARNVLGFKIVGGVQAVCVSRRDHE
jgi:hypothetical protein